MGLVHDEEEILGEVVDQALRPLPGLPAGEGARVVLDAGAVADLVQHLEIVLRAHLEPLRLEELSLGAELRQALLQLLADEPRPLLEPEGRRDEVLRRVDRGPGERLQAPAGQRIEDRDPLHLVPEELDPDGGLLVGRMDLDHVPARAEGPAPEIHVVPGVEVVHQLLENRLARDLVPHRHHQHLAPEILG